MEANKFELTGKITFIDVNYKENGTIITRALMSKKGTKENDFMTYAITLFNSDAEGFATKIQKGDYANVSGRITVDKYEKDGKKIEKLSLIGYEYKKVKYDESQKKYVEVEETKKETVKPWEK